MKSKELITLVREVIHEVKEENKLPKSSGKLIDLKKELKALQQMKMELQAAKFADKTASTEVEFSNLQKFSNELNKLKQAGIILEQSIDQKITELKTKIQSEKERIKEMIGIIPSKKQEPLNEPAREEVTETIDWNKGQKPTKGQKVFQHFDKKDEKNRINTMVKQAKSNKPPDPFAKKVEEAHTCGCQNHKK